MREEKVYLNSSTSEAEIIKDSLENLFLFLNEIDKIINSDDMSKDIANENYKLKQIERYLSEMNNMFEYLHYNVKVDKNKIS